MRSPHEAPEDYVSTTLPFASPRDQYTPEQLAEGEAACMLPRGVRERALALPSFPHRLAIAPSECKFRIGPSPLGGLGMFATTDFAAGDIILDERPLLVTIQRLSAGSLGLLKEIVAQMPERSRTAYLGLANVKGNTCAPEVGILRTNAFGVDLPGCDETYAAVYEHASRCNHSCIPNAITVFHQLSFSSRLSACRPIRAGEEITVAYAQLYADRATRLQDLQRLYSFHCRCPSCSLWPRLPDRRLQSRDN
ncbi:hypothetical protein BOTBODRAFT_67895 [Botryobasidium botryosum FD-172 SS1]|uniref:SET domain-containing protein n=1 Tax=Botryobasidium botryosum (strain FD-172 SS1) TaxID=930990 RepID=A0A067M6W6_BOTB1|nr:hypothetical protein BOTBODRAFT_67895 [Botryobasidium botryosum FD-172 SS1]